MKKIAATLFAMYLGSVYGDNQLASKFALGLGYTPDKYVKLVENTIQSKPKICVIFDDVAYKCKKYKITDSDDLVVNPDNSILVKSIVGARVLENLNIDLCNPTITFPVYYMIFWHVGRNSDSFKDTVIYPTYVLDNEDGARLSFLNKYGVTQYCMNSNYNLSDEDIIKT